MIHRCQILKANLKHCQPLGGDESDESTRLKIINAELHDAIGVDGGVRAPVNSKLGREFENWTKTSVGMKPNPRSISLFKTGHRSASCTKSVRATICRNLSRTSVRDRSQCRPVF